MDWSCKEQWCQKNWNFPSEFFLCRKSTDSFGFSLLTLSQEKKEAYHLVFFTLADAYLGTQRTILLRVQI
jgi:hypothetical protein